jgi:hypothetical protein
MLAAAVEDLKREFSELQQLRETVAEAERVHLSRHQRSRARPLS